MPVHTPLTKLQGQLTQFHPNHATWHLNKSGKWIARNRRKYAPKVIFIEMQYTEMLGDTVTMSPVEEVLMSVVRERFYFSLDKDHVRVRNLEFRREDLTRTYQRRGRPRTFWYQRMTDDDLFLVDLEVKAHADDRFDIVDVRVRSPVDHCKFSP